MNKTTIYICDDQLLFLESIEAFFNLQENYHCIGHSDTIEKAIADIKTLLPDIILIDYHLKNENGLDLLYLIRSHGIESKCFMLTMRRDVAIRNKAKDLGGSGYLLKSIGAEEMINAIDSCLNGKTEFYDSLEQEYLIAGNKYEKRLSTREIEIAKLVCKEYSSEEIATKLGLSLHTVSTHRKNILKKMNAKNTIDLLMMLKETYGVE